MSGTLSEFNKQAPGLFTEREMYNAAAKYIKSTGFQVDEYLAPFEKFQQTGEQMRQQSTQAQQAAIALEDRKLKVDEEANAIKRFEAETDRMKLGQDKDLKVGETVSKERIASKKTKA